MAKRLVEIDDDLLERARSIARTGTIKETVNAALQRLVDDERVMRHVERLRGSGALDLARIEEARRGYTLNFGHPMSWLILGLSILAPLAVAAWVAHAAS